MAGLKNIKIKIQSVNKTRKVTRAMEAVSAVKMRKAQERALGTRPYARAALRVLSHIAGVADVKAHPLVHKDHSKDLTCIVLVTSDKGLAGSLNASVLRMVQKFIAEHKRDASSLAFICLGRRGYEFAKRNGYDVVHYLSNINDSVPEWEIREITNMIVEMQMQGDVRKVYMAYTNFKSTFEQEAVLRQVLPLRREVLGDIVKGIVPEKGKFSEMKKDDGNGTKHPTGYTIEPSAEEVLAEVLPRLVNVAVFHALMEAKASEHSARMVAMKNATDKAKEVAKDLSIAYNKARQAAITAEVSEITSGIEAMK